MGKTVEATIDELNTLADQHIPESWRRVTDAEIECSVCRTGTSWTVTFRCRSPGGLSRHLWFVAGSMDGAVALARRHLGGPWRGWVLVETNGRDVMDACDPSARCVKCGRRRDDHHVRHPFVEVSGG